MMLRRQVTICPVCPSELNQGLSNNGSYLRSFPLEVPGETVLTWIYRKLCACCRTSFSLHPEFILKRRRYSLTFVAAWLWAFLKGSSTRSREFLEAHQVKVPPDDPHLSWSDSLDQPGQRTRPGYQLLHRWSVRFCQQAQERIEDVMKSSIQAGQLKIAEGWSVPEKARSLQLAWLYWEAMWRSNSDTNDIDSDEAFRQLVRVLSQTKTLSHKGRRDGQRRFPYDVLIQ